MSVLAFESMHTTVLLVWSSSFLVISATLILLSVSADTYSDINELTRFLSAEVQIFKVTPVNFFFFLLNRILSLTKGVHKNMIALLGRD